MSTESTFSSFKCFAARVRDSILVMKSKVPGLVRSQEMNSESFLSQFDGQSGPISSSLAEGGWEDPAAVADEQSGVGCKSLVLQPMSRCFEKYGLRTGIGQGAFGQVLLADDRDAGVPVAIKAIKRPRNGPGMNRALCDIVNERDILRDLSCKPLGPTFVTKFRESFVDAHGYYIVMDYCSGGDLHSVITRHGGRLPNELIRFYAAELLTAVQFLHDNGVIHRDLKPENLLLRNGHLVISDFGIAHAERSGTPTRYAGTPGYASPEMYFRKSYSNKIDIWAIGCIVYEMFAGYTPFDPRKSEETMYGELFYPGSREMDDELKDLTSKMLEKDPSKRPSVAEALSHAFFAGIDLDIMRRRAYYPPGDVGGPTALKAPTSYIPAEKLAHPEFAYLDWPRQFPQDAQFFLVSAKERATPRSQSHYIPNYRVYQMSPILSVYPSSYVHEGPAYVQGPLEWASGEIGKASATSTSPSTTVAGSWLGDGKWML